MRFPQKRKQIFGACILFLMVTLALATAVLAVGGQMRSGSYSLVIEKKFADDLSPEEKAEANKMTFTFRVEAQVKSGDGYTPVQKVVNIKGERSETVDFGNAFKVSVIEQTTDGGFKLPGNSLEWNVTKTECVSSMHVGASTASVNISKDGGYIEVSRPAGVPDVAFKLTGKPLHGTQAEFDQKFTQNQVKTVKAGETVRLAENLPQGEYTITKLRAADGFDVLVKGRDFAVPAGGEGKVHINGDESVLSIKAPDPEGDVELTHHYNVSGRDSNGNWQSRDIDVQSGQTGKVEHLPEGTYTIKVSETYDGIKGYTVTVPTLKEIKNRTTSKTSALYTGSSGNYKNFSVSKDASGKLAAYVEVYGFGPLYDSQDEEVNGAYKFFYGTRNPETGKIASYNLAINSTKITSYKFNDPVKLAVPASDGKVYFLALNVSNNNAKKLGVKWREYVVEEKTKTIQNPSAEGNKVTIAEPGYLILSKPKDTTVRADQVKYYYTITDSNGDPITNFTVTDPADTTNTPIAAPTDKNGTTVMLKAGESVKISGLSGGGNYHIKEEVEEAPAKGFHVTLEDTEKSVTSPGGSISIETLAERTVEIRRPGDPTDDLNRVYTYEITKVGDNDFKREIKLKSGETTTVMEATGSKLPAGKYTIKAVDDQIVGFDVAYSDSSSLTSNYIKTATVTFTNHFAQVKKSYHVIHEYYLKNKDGSYTFEGASPVLTKNCDGVTHNDEGGHVSKDVHLLDVFGGQTYTHFDDAYGKVVSWPKDGTPIDVETVLNKKDEGTGQEDGDQSQKLKDGDPDSTVPDADDQTNNDPSGSTVPDADDQTNSDPSGSTAPDADDQTNSDPSGSTAPDADDQTNSDLSGSTAPDADDQTNSDPSGSTAPDADGQINNDPNVGDVNDGNNDVDGSASDNGGQADTSPDGSDMDAGIQVQADTAPDSSAADGGVPAGSVPDGGDANSIAPNDAGQDGIGPDSGVNDGDPDNSDVNSGDPDVGAPADNVPDGGDANSIAPNDAGQDGNGSDAQNDDDPDGSGINVDGQADNGQGSGSSGDDHEQNKTIDIPAADFLPDPNWKYGNATGAAEDPITRYYDYVPLENLTCAMATEHGQDGAHDHGAQIIILRYYRELEEEEVGKYNVIHVYYQRTNEGDKLDGIGHREMETINVGRLTDDNRYQTYDASGVEKLLHFTPENNGPEYPYVYDGAVYGRVVKKGNRDISGADGGEAGNGLTYRKDDTMTSVKATPEGDQIIILRYYRSGGYKVVHEYYYQKKADQAVDSGEIEETPGGEGEGESTPEVQEGTPPSQSRSGESGGFSGTLTDSGGFTYQFEGKSGISSYSDALESRHDADEVSKETRFTPQGKNEQFKYDFKDAVYGYLDKDGTYRLAPYKDSVAATAQDDEIIILRYIREDNVPTPSPGGDPIYAYRVVHEYYLEDADGNRTLEGKTSVSKVDSPSAGRYDQSDVERLTSFDGREYVYAEDAYGTWSRGQDYTAKPGKTYINANTSGDQIIILRYVRKEPPKTEVSYKVIHEYYFRDPEGKEILVGTSEIRAVLEASPDVQYTQADVGREPDFQGETYTYFGDGYGTVSDQDYSEISGQQYVLATGSGEQIIILRYVREEKPEDPSQTPEDPPKDPEHPTEPPDPNDPDSPDEVTIWENEVPKTYIKVWDPEKEEWVYLPEVDIPLWNRIPHVSIGNNIPGKDLLVTIPQPDAGSYVPVPDAPPENRVPPTGDEDRSGLWAALAAAALCGCAALTIVPGKRKTK